MLRCPDGLTATASLSICGVLLGAVIAGCSPARQPETANPPGPNTAPVVRQDLTTRDEFPGRFGYAASTTLTAARDGVLTWLPSEGTVLRRGGVAMEIDGVATRILIGKRPAWRPLSVTAADGPDITQLNDNLAALGYAKRTGLPDRRFDWRTREAVRSWQADLGQTATGAVQFGDVAFLPANARLGTVEATLGARVGAGEPVATLTSTELLVTVDLALDKHDRMRKGTSVVVVLPDRTELDATVRSVGRVTSTDDAGDDPTAPVVIEPTRGTTAGQLDGTPVGVRVDRVLVRDALTVPVSALVARSGGGYAVERLTGAGTALVAVKPGQFADGLVEITGDIAPGDKVVVP